MRCLSCHYDLRKLAERRCPECGREFDPGDVKTFDSGGRRKSTQSLRGWKGLVNVFALAYLIAFLFSYQHTLLFYKSVGVPVTVSRSLQEAAFGGLIWLPFALLPAAFLYALFLFVLGFMRRQSP
jgi:hypothetical protein